MTLPSACVAVHARTIAHTRCSTTSSASPSSSPSSLTCAPDGARNFLDNKQIDPTARLLFRKICKGLDEQNVQISLNATKILQLEAQNQHLQPKKRARVIEDPNVKWVYLAITAFVWCLAVIFWLANIPEVTDADMAFQAQETHSDFDEKPFRKQYRLFHASFAQFCYTGAQVAIASFFINYVTETRAASSDSQASNLFAGAQGAFAAGRFIGAAIMHYVKPRKVFIVFLSCCAIFLIPAVIKTGTPGLAMLYIVLFFESVCFPTIVGLGMRGLGRHSKRGSGLIVAGVSGGACVPPLMGAVADMHNDMGIAMTVPLTFFVAATSYAVAVNFVPHYRNVTDAFTTTEIGINNTTVDEKKAHAQSIEDVQIT